MRSTEKTLIENIIKEMTSKDYTSEFSIYRSFNKEDYETLCNVDEDSFVVNRFGATYIFTNLEHSYTVNATRSFNL